MRFRQAKNTSYIENTHLVGSIPVWLVSSFTSFLLNWRPAVQWSFPKAVSVLCCHMPWNELKNCVKRTSVNVTTISEIVAKMYFDESWMGLKNVFLSRNMNDIPCTQCDQRLGDFLKFLATRFLAKEAQNYWQLLGYFEKPYSFVKTALATFWATFGKIGLLFTPTSGHTACTLNWISCPPIITACSRVGR